MASKKTGGGRALSTTARARKAAAKKAVKKRAVKKAAARGKASAKKASAKKASAKKASAKKASAKKAATKKAATKKASAKKASAKKASAKKAATKKAATKKAATKKAAAKKAAAKRAAIKKKTARRKAPAGKAPARKKGARATKAAVKKTTSRGRAVSRTNRRRWQDAPVVPPGAIPGLSEEDQIRSAKYLPRELPGRVFEEERFLFPESYGVNRVRLLVRDPEWVFAYWDVSAETMRGLARSLGERAFRLSRLTLRVLDPVSGGASDILLPPGARWWYIRTDAARRTYRAEIGITLPSGEFRRLAESNSVVTPRVGPSRERARRRLSYAGAGDVPPEEAAAAGRADRHAGLASEPWAGEGVVPEPGGPRGGASESFRPARPGGEGRPGASDTFRPGARNSDRR
jgi:hypothetical protein